MPPGSMAETLPLGPSTRTVLPFSLTVYLTPAGRAIGFLPIRDMMIPFVACESPGIVGFHCSLEPKAQIQKKNDARSGLFFFTRLRRGSRRLHLRDGPDDRS